MSLSTDKSYQNRQLLLFVALFLFTCVAAHAWPPRSTNYDDGYELHPHRAGYLNPEITLEAWIYREQTGCGTVAMHGVASESFEWVICDFYSIFYRANSISTSASMSVPLGNWTHVAVTYDGTDARFYMNGALKATRPLSYGTSINTAQGYLRIGSSASNISSYWHFYGSIDELRIWSRARTPQEISQNFRDEVHQGTDLVSAFASGGYWNNVSGEYAIEDERAYGRDFGVLPIELDVPMSQFVNLDGVIDMQNEYGNADVMPILYRDSLRDDGVAYVVHNGTDLFIGIPRDSLAAPGYFSSFQVYIDGAPSATAQPDSTDFYFDTRATIEQERFFQGNGGTAPFWNEICLASDPWCDENRIQAIWSCGNDDVCGSNKNLEIRVPGSLIGSFNNPDARLALAYQAVPDGFFNYGFASPVTVTSSSVGPNPSRWAPLEFLDPPAVPKVSMSGRVHGSYSPVEQNPVEGYTVWMRANGIVIAEATTSNFGWFQFNNVEVPSGADITLGVDTCSGCFVSQPITHNFDREPPLQIGANYVVFEGCTDIFATCAEYPQTSFFVLPELEYMSLSHATTTSDHVARSGYAGVELSTTKDSQPEIRRLHGDNLHPVVEVYLATPPPNELDPELWNKRQARVVGWAEDFSWLEVELPVLAANSNTWYADQQWMVKDLWPRLGHQTWTFLEDPNERFDILPAPYGLSYGWGWQNEGPKSWWPPLSPRGFSAVYGENAYLCAGAFGVCATHVPDPLYFGIFYPAYLIARALTPASCFGMAGSSLLVHQGYVDIADLGSNNVYYPAGFTELDNSGDYDGWGVLGPAKPANPAALVESNHAKQLSANALYHFTADSLGNPVARLNEIKNDPYGQVLCMYDSGFGNGHCVVPFKVEDTDPNIAHIWVYDNNFEDIYGRIVTIDKVQNTYSYALTDADLHGTKIATYPLSIWSDADVRFPLDIFDLLEIVVMGSAGATGDPGGPQVDVASIPLYGNGEESDAHYQFISTDNPEAALVVEHDGSDLQMIAGQEHQVLALTLDKPVASTADFVAIAADSDLAARSLRYQPTALQGGMRLKAGMRPDKNGAVAMSWWGLEIHKSEEVETNIVDVATPAASVRNGTARDQHYDLVIDMVAGGEEWNEKLLYTDVELPAGSVQTVRLVDWPYDRTVVAEIDFDGDGQPDHDELLEGLSCAEPQFDCNDNGTEDLCEIVLGTERDDDRNDIPDSCEGEEPRG